MPQCLRSLERLIAEQSSAASFASHKDFVHNHSELCHPFEMFDHARDELFFVKRRVDWMKRGVLACRPDGMYNWSSWQTKTTTDWSWFRGGLPRGAALA